MDSKELLALQKAGAVVKHPVEKPQPKDPMETLIAGLIGAIKSIPAPVVSMSSKPGKPVVVTPCRIKKITVKRDANGFVESLIPVYETTNNG